MSSGNGDLYLRDVLDLPESVLAGSFKVELSGGFDATADRVREYVVTPQLEQSLRKALKIVEASVRAGSSDAAYLHGSFGSGKSHFMTVLHAILSNDPAARTKPTLQPIIADHDAWLRDRKFLMVPFHLVGATDLDSAILGGYVRTVQRLHADAPVPPVYRADAMFEDARRQREFFSDDTEFVRWLGNPSLPKDANAAPQEDADDEGDLVNLDVKEAPEVWTAGAPRRGVRRRPRREGPQLAGIRADFRPVLLVLAECDRREERLPSARERPRHHQPARQVPWLQRADPLPRRADSLAPGASA